MADESKVTHGEAREAAERVRYNDQLDKQAPHLTLELYFDQCEAAEREHEAALRALRHLADCDVDEDRSTVAELVEMAEADRACVAGKLRAAEQENERLETETDDFCEAAGGAVNTSAAIEWCKRVDARVREGRMLLHRMIKYAKEDRAETPGSTRLARLAETVSDYLTRTGNTSDVLRTNQEDEHTIDELMAKRDSTRGEHRMVTVAEVEQARREGYERGRAEERKRLTPRDIPLTQEERDDETEPIL